MEVDVLGIDLAKRVFQLHGATRTGVVVNDRPDPRRYPIGELKADITRLRAEFVMVQSIRDLDSARFTQEPR